MKEESLQTLEDLFRLETLLENPSLCYLISKEGLLSLNKLSNYLKSHPLYCDDNFEVEVLEKLRPLPDQISYDKERKAFFSQNWVEIFYLLKIQDCEVEEFFSLEEIYEKLKLTETIKEQEYNRPEKTAQIVFNFSYETNQRIKTLVEHLKSHPDFKEKPIKTYVKSLRQLLYSKTDSDLQLPAQEKSCFKNEQKQLENQLISSNTIINLFLEIRDQIEMSPQLKKIDQKKFPIISSDPVAKLEELDPTIYDLFAFSISTSSSNNRHKSFKSIKRDSFKKPLKKNSLFKMS